MRTNWQIGYSFAARETPAAHYGGMDRKQAQQALDALDKLPKATNWRERATKARTADRLRAVPRRRPRPIYGPDLPF